MTPISIPFEVLPSQATLLTHPNGLMAIRLRGEFSDGAPWIMEVPVIREQPDQNPINPQGEE